MNRSPLSLRSLPESSGDGLVRVGPLLEEVADADVGGDKARSSDEVIGKPFSLLKRRPLWETRLQPAQILAGAKLSYGERQHCAPADAELHRVLHLVGNTPETVEQQQPSRP